MGTSVEHQGKWRHNRAFLATIDDEQFSDWRVTVSFYTAIHAVEALFARDNVSHGGSHTERNRILKSRQRYHPIWQYFRTLHDASMAARYDCYTGDTSPSFQGWISPADVRDKLIKKHLYGVESLVIKFLSLDRAQYPPIHYCS